MAAIASQHLEPDGFIPGFWLPGTAGPRTGLRAFEGRILVVGLWSPSVPESLPVLELLRDLHDRYARRGVAVIAICIAEDNAVSGHFARENRYPFPMLYDPGARATENASAGSPVAEAYDAAVLPKLVVAGRDRAVRYAGLPTGSEDTLAVQAIDDLLTGQP
jgi:peroxiredoxin